MTLFLISSLITLAAALSSQCDNGDTCTDPSAFCIANTFCVSSEAADVVLFVAGMASEFVEEGDLQEAQCLEQAEEDISEFGSALAAWENGDYSDTWTDLSSAVSSVQSVVSACAPTEGGDDSFWSDVVDAVEVVGGALCPECAQAISDVEFVVDGVDIIDDWVTMYKDCSAGDADDIVACGAAFGSSVKTIYDAVGKDTALVEEIASSTGDDVILSVEIISTGESEETEEAPREKQRRPARKSFKSGKKYN